MIKAAFFDIDGTILPLGCRNIPDDTLHTLYQMRDAGIKVFISSGRHIEWIGELDNFPFDGYVSANGALCLLDDRKTIVHQHDIDTADIVRLAEFSHSHDIPFVIIPAEGGIFFTALSQHAIQGIEMLHLPKPRIAPADEAIGKPIVQLMAFASTEEMQRCRLFEDVLPDCEPTSWSILFADITPKGSDKAIGITKMAEHFGIRPEECIAFGDGENDISMLRAAGIGVAMGNASDAVKQAADFVTKDCDKGGISEAFNHFCK